MNESGQRATEKTLCQVEVFQPERDYTRGIASKKRHEVTAKPAGHYKERDQALEQINEANVCALRRLPEETDAQAENKNQIGDEIAERVEAPASFRIEILGACNLAVTSVQNIDQLEKCGPDQKPGVVTVHQKDKSHQSGHEDQHRPSVGSNRQPQDKPRDYARDRAVQKLRNHSVLRFADVAKELFFGADNLARVREKTPVLFFSADRASTGSLELLEESWPRSR